MENYPPAPQKEKRPTAFQKTREFWLELTRPHSSIEEPDLRLRSRLLSYLLMAVFLAAIGSLVLSRLFLGFQENTLWNLAIAALIVVAYGLNRAGRYHSGLGLALIAIWLSILYTTISIQQAEVLNFFILVVLLSNLSFIPRLTILGTAACITTVTIMALSYPWVTAGDGFTTTFLITITGAIGTVGVVVLRRYSRQNYQQARQLKVERQILEEEMEKRIAAEERLIHEALHDPLTGLPNRRLFINRIEHARDWNRRHPEDRFAVVYLDLDRFKVVNDSQGHGVGDELLVALANRLSTAVRSVDTVARIGGDEFVILIEGVEDDVDVHAILNRIMDHLSAPYTLGDDSSINITASMGVVLNPHGYDQIDDILRDADFAMYNAKVSGKNRYEIFEPAMRARAEDEFKLESGLRAALGENQFRVQYLPVYSLRNHQVTRFEALLRWDHPRRGRLYPADFLRTAEETGLIIPIGDWLMKEACKQMKVWLDSSTPDAPLSVSVNLSSRQFARPDLVERIDEILRDTGLPASRLFLELAEMTLIEDIDRSVEKIRRLHELGVGVEIDDFGTGYSSLGYLRRLPVNHLKIDRSFTSTLGVSESAVPIIRAIIAMANSLGIEVIAEGIETQEQVDNLLKMNCGFGQGFFFNKAVDAEIAEGLIQQPA